jgi:hypothetical protein
MHSCSPLDVERVPPIPSFLLCSPELYLVRITYRDTPHFSFLHCPVIVLFGPAIFLSTLFSNTLSLCSSLSVERPSFTAVQNNWQNYIFVCFSFSIIVWQTRRPKITDRMVVDIPKVYSAVNFFMQTEIVNCECRSQVFEICHTFKVLIIYL